MQKTKLRSTEYRSTVYYSVQRPKLRSKEYRVQCILPYKDQNPLLLHHLQMLMCMLQFPREHQGNATKVSSPLLLSLHTERRTNRMQNPLIQCTPIVQQCIPLRKRKTSKIPSSSREKSSRTDNGTATMQYHHRCRPHPRGKGQATSHKQRVRGSGS